MLLGIVKESERADPSRGGGVADPPVIAVLLAFAGGGLVGFAFTTRGVFANAQTGNVVLLGVGLLRGEASALSALAPIVAFVLGVAAVAGLPATRLSRRGVVLLSVGAEAVAIIALALLPEDRTQHALVVVLGFVAALQTSAFRSLDGQTCSSTMATSDLRLLVESALLAVRRRAAGFRRLAVLLGAVVAASCIGAGVTAATTRGAGPFALLILAAPLLAVLGWAVLGWAVRLRPRRAPGAR